MMASLLKGITLLALASSAHAAMASEDANAQSSEVLGGFLILLGVVALAYAFVFVVRALTGSAKRGPDEMTAAEFDKLTTPSDRPSIERY